MLVTLTGHIKVPEIDLDVVRAELATHITLTRDEPGCLVFDVKADSDDPTIFHVYEQFSDPMSFTAHQERVRSSEWGFITANAKRHYEISGMPA